MKIKLWKPNQYLSEEVPHTAWNKWLSQIPQKVLDNPTKHMDVHLSQSGASSAGQKLVPQFLYLPLAGRHPVDPNL